MVVVVAFAVGVIHVDNIIFCCSDRWCDARR